MKLCKDCQHFIPKGEFCGRAALMPDYVHGKPSEHLMRAQNERIWPAPVGCGKEATHFRPILRAA